jgi:protein SCO1/2
LNGAALVPAADLSSLTFTRSDGGMFNSADTRGRISLFFFGYTHCADVCPLTLAQLSQMRRTLGGDAKRVDMYFVTLDPARDTPERMREYVANFPGIVGLIGSDDEVADAQASFHVLSQRREVGGGDYLLDHTAALYLVNSGSQIQLAYPYGTPPSDIVADLRRLLASASTFTIADAWARPADAAGSSAIYLRITNASDTADRLIGVSSPLGQAQMHRTSQDGGMMHMQAVGALDIAGGGEIRFEPGGLHIMLTSLQQTLAQGDEVPLTLTFERSGTLTVRAPVRGDVSP